MRSPRTQSKTTQERKLVSIDFSSVELGGRQRVVGIVERLAPGNEHSSMLATPNVIRPDVVG
jgi:hypothetical protein